MNLPPLPEPTRMSQIASRHDLEYTAAQLRAYAEQAVAAERERCARIVESHCGAWDDEGFALAAAIRKEPT